MTIVPAWHACHAHGRTDCPLCETCTSYTCAACGLEFTPADHLFVDGSGRLFCDGYCHADYLAMVAEDWAGES